jgi:CheY-like chemotaxis protein
MMGGEIEVETEEGVGSVFTFTFETREGEPIEHTATPASDRRLPQLRILVAEDSPTNQRVAQLLLRGLGQSCDFAAHGAEALEVVLTRSYDVVLMDMHMPELDGLDATRRIRAELASDRQPWIVATTGNISVEDRERCLEAGMDDFVTKPLRREALIQTLRRSVAEHPTATSSTNRPAFEPAAIERLEQAFGGRAAVAEAIELFLDEARELIVSATSALHDGHLDDARRSAHTLKSTALMFGAAALSSAAAEAETNLTLADPSPIAHLEHRLDEVRPPLLAQLSRLTGTPGA